MKTALITGIRGQDGSYLAELLLQKGYVVHGLTRSHCPPDDIHLHENDLSQEASLKSLIQEIKPDEVYHLAAPSHIHDFLQNPEIITHSSESTLHLLEALRTSAPQSRFFQANSAELFGEAEESPQTERTAFRPISLYGIAKLSAYWIVDYYRRVHHLFACNGILFNHESPRRKRTFVSKKIIATVARIHRGQEDRLVLGNLDTPRDWGYAKDFCEGMWQMLQFPEPEDFILATGRTTTVRKFVELAFFEAGIQIRWEGSGMDEKGIDAETGKTMVEVSSSLFRPIEKIERVGDPSKAKKLLGWAAQTSLEELIHIMFQEEMITLQKS